MKLHTYSPFIICAASLAVTPTTWARLGSELSQDDTAAPKKKEPADYPKGESKLALHKNRSSNIEDCVDSPEGWYDSDGPDYDCDWYSMDNRCAMYGDDYENLGKTANEACCACGGGQQGGCQDDPEGWYDSDGPEYDCDWYSMGNHCSMFGDSYENNGKTANEACCACGGGRTGTTTSGYGSCSYAGYSGECQSPADCDGFYVHGACPDAPAAIKCCLPGEQGEISPGGCLTPSAIENSNTIVANTCTTRWSTYASSGTSDHAACRASDIWPPTSYDPCAPSAAEYVMNNWVSLDVKYVIYGQRIWNPSIDSSPKPWSQWRTMADRGSVTANHWDHLHVSFNS